MTYEEAVRTACVRRNMDPRIVENYIMALARSPGHRNVMGQEIDDDELATLDAQIERFVQRNPPELAEVERITMLHDLDNPFIPRGA